MEFVQSLEEYFTLVRDETPTVMVFTAGWCPDCTFLKTFIDDVRQEYEGKLRMYWIDRDEYGDLCETLDIMGIPSFLAYKDGKVVSRFVNGKRKSKQEVEDFLNDFLSKLSASV